MANFIQRTELSSAYLKEISKYKVMTPEEELECFTRYREDGDISARDAIIYANQRFLFSMAKEYNSGDKLMDFVSQGNIGLCQAIERFDPTLGFKFFSYARWWILKEMNHFVLNDGAFIRKSNGAKTHVKLTKIKDDFYQKYERYPDEAEIALIYEEKYGDTIKNLNDLSDVQISHINSTVGDETGSSTLEETGEFAVATASHNGGIEYAEQEYSEVMTNIMFEVLRKKYKNEARYERDVDIVKMSFGIGYDRAYSNDEIALKYDLDKERIRQVVRDTTRLFRANRKAFLKLAV